MKTLYRCRNKDETTSCYNTSVPHSSIILDPPPPLSLPRKHSRLQFFAGGDPVWVHKVIYSPNWVPTVPNGEYTVNVGVLVLPKRGPHGPQRGGRKFFTQFFKCVQFWYGSPLSPSSLSTKHSRLQFSGGGDSAWEHKVVNGVSTVPNGVPTVPTVLLGKRYFSSDGRGLIFVATPV